MLFSCYLSYSPTPYVNKPLEQDLLALFHNDASETPLAVANNEEMQEYTKNHKNTKIGEKDKIQVPTKIFNRWIVDGKVKKVPHDFFALNGGVPEDGCDPFILGQNTAFVQYDPELKHQALATGQVIKQNEHGHVLVVASKTTPSEKNPSYVKYHYPGAYIIHEDGLVLCCKVTWGTYSYYKAGIESGMVEVLGERMDCYGESTNRTRFVFVRSYSVLRLTKNADKYLECTLYCDGCSKQKKTLYVSHLCLVTFVGPRPDGYVADHIGERLDNSIQNLQWLRRRDNSKKRHLHPDKK